MNPHTFMDDYSDELVKMIKRKNQNVLGSAGKA
jgi:hypothetical protein